LAEYFLRKFTGKYKKPIIGFTSDAMNKLENYGWPGNVRELQNTIERAVILSAGSKLKADDFILKPAELMQKDEFETLNLELIEQEAIEKALKRCEGNMNKAADMLGITRFALYRKMKK
jgi:DNA-binding NtrC family response regulator